jgi:hypothetical protein
VTGNANSLLATGVYGIVKMCSCAIFITFLADTLGRRWSFVWTGFAMWFCMFYLGFYVRFDPPKTDAPIPPAGYVALVMVYLFAAAFQFGWGPVCWIYVSEIPTNRLRGYNVSLAAATQWLFNLVVARVSLVMLVTAGGPTGYGTYFIYGSFCFAMGIAAFFVPETKGVSASFSMTESDRWLTVVLLIDFAGAHGRTLRGGRLLRSRGRGSCCEAGKCRNGRNESC